MLLWGELLISKTSSSFLNSGLCFTSDTAIVLGFIRPEASQAPLLYFSLVSERMLLRDVVSGAIEWFWSEPHINVMNELLEFGKCLIVFEKLQMDGSWAWG